ncbi:hypothetical protein MTO96_008529 [Rhipicephalus appendiculatus]
MSLKQGAVPSIFNFPSKRATAKGKPPKESGATLAVCQVQAADTVATPLHICPQDETSSHQTTEMSNEEDLLPPVCSRNHQQAEAEADGGRLGKLLTELQSTKEKLVYKELEDRLCLKQ